MKTPVLLTLASLGFAATISIFAAGVEPVDPAECGRIFPSDVQVRTLATGLKFTEGPVWYGGSDGFLIFSDIPANQLLKWVPDAGLSVFREPSERANGNTLDLQGRLVTCEHWGRRVSLTKRDGTVISLISEHRGRPLNSPNDVVAKSDGTIWFTDPDYGLEGRPKEQPGNFVFRYDPLPRELAAVVEDFDKPNGLCFSPDESKLYVADSGKPRHIRVFQVRHDNTLAAGTVFAVIDRGGPDGIRCDRQGRIWSSSGDGVQVFTADGRLVARIVLPKGAANLCFGGPDQQTVFITARDALYAVETKVHGAR